MLETSRQLSTRCRTLQWHRDGYVYETSDADGQLIVASGAAEVVDDSTPTGRQTPKPPAKKKTKKSKGKVEPVIPDDPLEDSSADEVVDGEV
jgi:hypothetical protein